MKKLIVISISLVITLTLATLFHDNTALASSYAFNQGYWDARDTYMNGGNFHDFCSFKHSDSYCFDYKLGYRAGWTAAEILHGRDSG